MKRPNIIWFVIDGVRQYRSYGDDRDRLDVMDELAKEAVEFTNAFTPAPSSVLAASTMLTGLPAVYICRHYNDFVFDESEIDSLVPMLKEHGYGIYSIFNARALRTAMQEMAHSLPSKLRPKIARHDEFWHNKALTDSVQHLFEHDLVEQPSFFLMWYNCRKDPNTSGHVEAAIETFKAHGMWDDAVVIMNSDHGYPDPSTGLTKEIMKKYSHDMIITEDNIKVPLFLKYPGCPKGRAIESVVRTADVFHTLLDYMEIPTVNRGKINYDDFAGGRSLLGTIEGTDTEPRIARIDTRLTSAFGRVSALRGETYKYIYYAEEDAEGFYDIKKDPYELRNIIDSKDVVVREAIDEFRRLFHEQEDHIFNYHLGRLEANIQSELRAKFPGKRTRGVQRILLTYSALTPVTVARSLVDNLNAYFTDPEIELLTQEKVQDKYEGIGVAQIHTFGDLSNDHVRRSEVGSRKYDLVIYLTEQSAYRFVDRDVVAMLKAISGKEFVMMDYNFKIYSRLMSKWIFPLVRFIKRNWRYYKDEPRMFPREFWKFVRLGFRMHILGVRAQTFFAEEIKISRDARLKEDGFDSDVLLKDIWGDRVADDEKRAILSEEGSK